MDDIPASQDTVNLPPIFRNADGTRWHIFVEAGGIYGRPKLIRILKKADAVICSDPKQARVILVDSNSIQGRLFIRDWGKDADKVVLEYSWVKSSISAGRVLAEADQWGGCLTSDDGLPIVKEETETSEILKSSRGISLATEPIQQRSPPSRPPRNISPQVAAKVHPERSEVEPVVPDPRYASNTLQTQPVHNGSLYPNPNPTNGFPDQNPYSLSQHIPVQTMQSQVQAQVQAQAQIIQSLLQQMNYSQQFHHSLQPSSGMGLWGAPAPLPPTHYNPQMNLNGTGQDLNMTIASQDNQSPMYTASQELPDVPASPSGIPPSHRRKSPIISRSRFHEGSASAMSSSASTSRVSARPLTPPPVTPSARTRPSAQPGSLFTSESGEALAFFVQIEQHNRYMVVSAIKKNGGKITNNHTTADYAILCSRSTTFKDLLSSTLAAGRPAVNDSFVHDSVAGKTLMDPSKYAFSKDSASRGKRKRSISPGTREDRAEKKRNANNIRRAEQRQKIKTESSPTKSRVSIPDDSLQPRSPTPPPEHTRVPLANGSYKFSEHEKEYVIRYVKVLLERDHQMSTNEIGKHLFRKMNNHSVASWRSFLSQTVGQDIDDLRKRASIAFRKIQTAKASSSKREPANTNGRNGREPQNDTWSSRSPTLELPIVDQEARQRELQEEDLEVVSKYFAVGGGDSGEADEIVWARLTAQVKCKTADDWETFYTIHSDEVMDRYNKLKDAEGDDT